MGSGASQCTVNQHCRKGENNTLDFVFSNYTKDREIDRVVEWKEKLFGGKNLRPCSFFREVDKWRIHHRIG